MSNVYHFVVPYRHRPDNLTEFLHKFPVFLDSQDYIDGYSVSIIEQDDSNRFNLGALINIGFINLTKIEDFSEHFFVFHPVDCYPTESLSYEVKDFPVIMYCDPKCHWGYPKAVGFRVPEFLKVNGYSNQFWAWGGEDEEMYHRLRLLGIPFENRQCNFEMKETIHPPGFADKSNIPRNTELPLEFLNHKNIFYSGLNTLDFRINFTHHMFPGIILHNVTILNERT